MTDEQKRLLVIDLAGRLPYGVKALLTEEEGSCVVELVKNVGWYYISGHCEKFKPYLRPMSDMTEEELEYVDRNFTYTSYNEWDYVDFLNANHFDYRGLIPMGLAIAVTEENNPYKDS